MNLLIKLCLIAILSITLTSCGVDKLKLPIKASDKSNLNQGMACGCNSSYSPVCASDGNNYDNSCIAECKQVTVTKVGHCVCSNEMIVCGSDGQNHTECEAVNSTSYQITKFIPCNATEL